MKIVTPLLAVAQCLAAQCAAKSPGCGKQHSGGSLTSRTIKSSGIDRTYHFHLPQDYDEEDAHPTVIAFHGLTGTGRGLANSTKMNDKRWTGDKIAVYPDGVNKRWAGADYSNTTITQDLDFVLDILEDLREEFCIDDSRIYAAGHSNGGGFTDIIACNATVGGEFAAFAPVAGAYYQNNDETHGGCDPARALTPVLEIHGGADDTVPYEGGPGNGGVLPSIPDWLDRWSERNGCDEPETEDLSEGITFTSWKCGKQDRLIEHYYAKNHDHGWPTASAKAWPKSGNDLIFAFFDRFTKTGSSRRGRYRQGRKGRKGGNADS